MKIVGTWYNELGSSMVLAVHGKIITGTYHTKVGDATGEYELVGQIDTDDDQSTAIGWVVLWNNHYGSSDSVTTWSGQVQDIGGVTTIVTTWLLTAETEPDDDWHSTLIGKDTFTQTEPTADRVHQTLEAGQKYSFPHKKLNMRAEG